MVPLMFPQQYQPKSSAFSTDDESMKNISVDKIAETLWLVEHGLKSSSASCLHLPSTVDVVIISYKGQFHCKVRVCLPGWKPLRRFVFFRRRRREVRESYY